MGYRLGRITEEVSSRRYQRERGGVREEVSQKRYHGESIMEEVSERRCNEEIPTFFLSQSSKTGSLAVRRPSERL